LIRVSPLRRLSIVAAAGVPAVLSACGSEEQSTLDPASPPARDIERLWWVMMTGGWIVFGGTIAFLVIGWVRRRETGWPFFGEREGLNLGLVVGFGLAVPLVVLSGLFVYANIHVLGATSAPAEGDAELTIEVTGHQWFWEVRYPGTDAVTANEIHIPAMTQVEVVARTDDVIHSFWVPRLNRKIDMIPGQENRLSLFADRPGTYRGQCSEFCGLQHGHMAFVVIAQEPAAFRSWLEAESQARPPPASAEARRGEELFSAKACAGCHTIRGTDAAGSIGPDLTHVGSRGTLAALTIPNTPEELAGWIRNPQAVKPGAKMPALGLTEAEIDALVAYLEGNE
jgi:cytochrome c oxidase subunit 2